MTTSAPGFITGPKPYPPATTPPPAPAVSAQVEPGSVIAVWSNGITITQEWTDPGHLAVYVERGGNDTRGTTLAVEVNPVALNAAVTRAQVALDAGKSVDPATLVGQLAADLGLIIVRGE